MLSITLQKPGFSVLGRTTSSGVNVLFLTCFPACAIREPEKGCVGYLFPPLVKHRASLHFLEKGKCWKEMLMSFRKVLK